MEYWILQHNPQLLPADIPHPGDVPQNRDYWHISRYGDEVGVGDVAFIWHAGAKRGIYGVSTIVSVPPHTPEANEQIRRLTENDARFWTDSVERDRLRQQPTILIEYQYPNMRPISASELMRRGLSGLPVLQMPQRCIYKLDESTGRRVLDFIRRTRP